MAENELRAELDRANAAAKALERERDEKMREAAAVVRAEYAERIGAANKRRVEADRAMRDYIEATASHPWEGKKVKRTERKRTSTWSNNYVNVVVLGVVEICRSNTELPGNKSWGMPKIGEPFVRLLLKNGEPGKKVDEYRPGATYPIGSQAGQPVWSLVEEARLGAPAGDS